MNAQTAAVIDFQSPRTFRPKAIKGSRDEVSIRFKSRVSTEAAYKLSAELSHYFRMFEKYTKYINETGEHERPIHYAYAKDYSGRASGLIEALLLLGSIHLSERTRLLALFAEQADLFAA